MKIQEVPQDRVPTLRGYSSKALYARDDEGRFTTVPSSGWEVEELVLRDVLAEFERLTDEARARVRQGETSPIEYFMYRNLMDLPALAQGIGFARWRVRRHFKPGVFRRLKPHVIERYAEFFKIDSRELMNFKETD